MTSLPDLDQLAARVRAAESAAQNDPSRRLELAGALLNYGEGLGRCGRADEAIAAHDQALVVVRELAMRSSEEAYAIAHADALDARASLLRSLGRHAEAVEAAEQALTIVARLAHHDAVRYLLVLARLTENLGRCYQQARRFDRAAAAFEQAVAAFAILARTQPHAHGITLIQAMSNHALALAQSGEIERAHAVALSTLELAEREPGWGLLPLITGSRQFLADLSVDRGRPEEAFEHLVAGMRLLREAIAEQLPGAAEAAMRLGASLQELCEAQGLAVPEDLAAMLSSSG